MRRYDPTKVQVFPFSQGDFIGIGFNGRNGMTTLLKLADADVEMFIRQLRYALAVGPAYRARNLALARNRGGEGE